MFGQQSQQSTGLGGLFSSTTSAAPAFPTATTTTSSLFGQQSTTGGLFGAKPAGTLFGATATTQAQPAGGMFGQPQQQTATGFGTGSSLFGPAKPATSAFGQPAQSSIFGQPQPQQTTSGLFGPTASSAGTGAFGTTTTTPSIFGGAAPAFGQQTQQQAGGGLFGPKPAVQPAFGGTFGTGAATQPNTGTNVVKFSPPTGSDTMQLKGQQSQVTTKQMCVSAMKEYETRSLEELRVADYIAGRKVNTAAAPAGSMMFGPPAQQQNTGIFSGGLAKPSGGLFSTTTAASAFPTATTTTTSLFNQPTQSTGIFGGQKPTGTLFGPTTSTQPAANIFGQPQQPAAAAGVFGTGGSLFGPKPTTSAFGPVSQPNIFGQPQQQTGGIFGTTAPSSNAFGATTTTPSIFGGGGANAFGQQQQQAGIFGPKPAGQPAFGGFNAPQQQPPPFGTTATGPSIFGSTAPKIGGTGIFGTQQPTGTTGIFGTGAQVQPAGGGLFGPAATQQTAFGGAPTSYGGSPPILIGSNVNTASVQRAIIEAQLSTLPYGDSPLLKSPTSPRRSPQDISNLQRQLYLGPRKPLDQLLPPPTSTAQNGTSTTTNVSTTTDTTAFKELSKDSTGIDTSLLDGSFSYKPMVLLPSVGFGTALGLHQSPKLVKSKSSEKSLLSDKSYIRLRSDEEKKVKSLDMSVVLSEDEQEPPMSTPLPILAEISPMVRSTAQAAPERPAAPQPVFDESAVSHVSPTPTPTTVVQQKAPQKQAVTPPPTQPAKKYRVKLTRPEYYTEPSLDELERLFNADGVCRLEGGLTVGRMGYGSVFWKGPVELREPVDLDEIVHFRSKEIIVYPDESKKPDIGEGLNKPAEVSLERIWPVDPKTKQMIKDPDELRRIGFREKLERLSQRMDATFRDYQPGTGTWQFEVQHFSKYGFLEDDDEEAAMETAQPPANDPSDLKKQAHLQAMVQKAKIPLREVQKNLEGTGEPPTAQQVKRNHLDLEEQLLAVGEGGDYFVDFDDEDTKAFQEAVMRKKFKFDEALEDSNKLLGLSTAREEAKRRPLLVRLPKTVFKGLSALNITNSILQRAGIILQRRSCRVGFTQELYFTSIPAGGHENVVNICQTNVVPTIKNYFSRFIAAKGLPEQQAMRQLESSKLIRFEPQPSPLLRFLDNFILTAQQNGVKDIDKAVFGIFTILLMDTTSMEGKIHQRTQMGNWLRTQLANVQLPPTGTAMTIFAIIFHFLVNGSIQQAIDSAKRARHYNLALLLSLYKAPAGHLVRQRAAQQLALMDKRVANPHYIKIFELLSREWNMSRECLEGLNWLQILGIIIWYHATPTTTLPECLEALEELIK